MFDAQILKSTKFNVQMKPTQPKRNEHRLLACFLSHFILHIFFQGPVLSGKFWWSAPVLGEPVWRDDHRCGLELVSKELNPLAAILHVYAEVLIFMK